MKDETFLEIMNSFLMTGEVPNLFPKVLSVPPPYPLVLSRYKREKNHGNGAGLREVYFPRGGIRFHASALCWC